MPDYKEMYRILFRETTKAISALQNAQQQAEDIYIADDTEDSLIDIRPNHESDKNDERV